MEKHLHAQNSNFKRMYALAAEKKRGSFDVMREVENIKHERVM